MVSTIPKRYVYTVVTPANRLQAISEAIYELMSCRTFKYAMSNRPWFVTIWKAIYVPLGIYQG